MGTPFTEEELAAARQTSFVHRRIARFQDADAAGVLFFARVFDYFHDGYVELLESAGFQLARVLAEKVWIAPIRHSEAEFLHPIRFGDPLEVAPVRARFEASVLFLGHQIF